MKTIEIRVKANHAGKWINGEWQPAGQLIARLQYEGPQSNLQEVLNRLCRPAPPHPGLPDEEEWEVIE